MNRYFSIFMRMCVGGAQAGTKFVAGWNVGTCPVEQCGPAPVGQYYISVGRTAFDTCETRNCTNAPEGHAYVGGGGVRNQCPHNASSVTKARSGCTNPRAGHFFSSTVRVEGLVDWLRG